MSLIFCQDVNDTIAAISTGMSEAGIGIIRISGPDAGLVVERIFRTSQKMCACVRVSDWTPYTLHHGYILDADKGEFVDEVLVSWMKAPHSYTTEDTAEIDTHGGLYVLQKILSIVLGAGARPADPGEFTKRAFLGGRIDLSEAEGVMNLIHSQSEFSRRTAFAQMNGAVSGKIKEIRGKLLYEIAYIESALDDPEHYSLDGYAKRLDDICCEVIVEIQNILSRSENGAVLMEGIRTAIVGKPNSGKSSLFNILAGSERAIVTEIEGTTRDTITEKIRLHELTLLLIDTAGIRRTEDTVERLGITRSLEAMESAQLILFVMDHSRPISEEDVEIIQKIKILLAEGKKCLVLINKSDLLPVLDIREVKEALGIAADGSDLQGEVSFSLDKPQLLYTSITENKGIDALEDKIREMFRVGEISDSGEIFLTGEREKAQARIAMESLKLVRQSIADGMSEDFYSIDLQSAYTALGQIVGEAVEDDVVEEIFSKFCMGK